MSHNFLNLIIDRVMSHTKPRVDFSDLTTVKSPYKPTYLGHILFNGKLIHANASTGCFFIMNDNFSASRVPDNLRVSI